MFKIVTNKFYHKKGLTMEIFLHLIAIILLLAAIIYVCVLFTNAVENFGREYGLQDGAVGGILAAIGTALPETIVPLVAILGGFFTGSGLEVGTDIALGAVLGAPFLLSTVAFFVTGAAVLVFSKSRVCGSKMCANPLILIRDLKFFFVSYTLAVITAFIHYMPLKYLIAFLLIVYYLWYVKRTLKKNFKEVAPESNSTSEFEPLYLLKFFSSYKQFLKPMIWFQILISFVGLVVFAHLFVEEIKYFAQLLYIHPLIMSLLLAPVATELPECFNSIIWIKQSKDSLSVSNITGALVFQSCIPVAIGITLTPWAFTEPALINVILVYLSLIIIYINAIKNKGMLNWRILALCGIFYVIYIIYVLRMLI